VKVSKRLLSAVLISAVVIYTAVFTWSFLEYQRYVADTFELYEELGVILGYIDVYPYHRWNYGGVMVGIGIVLVLCVIGGSVTFKEKRDRKQSVITTMLVFLMLFVPLLTIANIEPVQLK